MIDEYLAFARGEAGEGTQSLSVAALLAQTGEDVRRSGATVD
jgi:two-component system osmolarity sensor histidine kinase EnvZ